MKKLYQSKTIVFNVIAFIVAVAIQFGLDLELSSDFQAFVLPVVFLINLVLRYITKEPVSL